MRSEAEANTALQKHADTVRRVCFLHLKNRSDVEDVFQEVFLKYLFYTGSFESDDHERSWFIRVAINACKDLLKSFYRRQVRSLEEADLSCLTLREESCDTFDTLGAVLALPPKYRDVIYLHYYEGYKAAEIASILGKKENTVYTWLARGREQLKSRLGGEHYER